MHSKLYPSVRMDVMSQGNLIVDSAETSALVTGRRKMLKQLRGAVETLLEAYYDVTSIFKVR